MVPQREHDPDPEFWFPDGNIILVAQNHVSFRVHQGILARHSDVFRDMFLFPQPLDSEDMSCPPMVDLSDSAADVRRLMRVLYDSTRFYLRREEGLDFREVEALIRLAQKYQVDVLRDHGLAHMKIAFPNTFKAWTSNGQHNSSSLAIKDIDAIAAVNLARHTGTLSMLPAALYCCSTLSSWELTKGIEAADGSVQRLSAEDLDRCVDGRVALSCASTAGAVELFLTPSPNCTDGWSCLKNMQTTMKATLLELTSQISPHHNCLREHDIDAKFKDLQMCSSCRQFVKVKDLQRRAKIWEKLPSFFGLEDWSVLRAADPVTS